MKLGTPGRRTMPSGTRMMFLMRPLLGALICPGTQKVPLQRRIGNAFTPPSNSGMRAQSSHWQNELRRQAWTAANRSVAGQSGW